MKELVPINYENQRIMTTSIIAEEYGTTERRISENFNANKSKYQEGKHYFMLQGNELKEFKNQYGNSVSVGDRTAKLYLWTEKGALLHAKSLNTDKAWEVYDKLVETYFRVKENVQPLNTSELSPELQMFGNLYKAIANQELEQKKIKAEIEDTKNQLQGIRGIVAINSKDWKNDCKNLITKIAYKLGGIEHIQDVYKEVYSTLDKRLGTKLQVRLTNKRRRMADEGVCKSKRDKLNYINVIEDDKKLIEGYIAIVKELSIKYGVDMN